MSEPDDLQQRPLNIDDSSQRYPLEKMTGGARNRGAKSHATPPRITGGSAGRVPPQAVDVEQSVLGAMMIGREAIPQAIEILPADAFYNAKHQKVYEAILALFERGNPVDLITLSEELKRRGWLDDIGGAYYLTELTTRVDTAANVEYHARIIAEKSLLRKLIETMTKLVGQSYDPSADAFEMLDQAERDIFKISDTQLRRPAAAMSQVVKETIEKLQAIHGRDTGITGVATGFTRLDDMTGGWQPSDLVIIAARPSMGKTAFALSMARNAALHPTDPSGIAIFSLEMSAQQLAQRLLTSEARVDAQAARTGRLRDDDWLKLARAAGRLAEAPIYIDDTPGLGILELRAKCRRLKAEHGIGLVVVDYLQLMHGSKDSGSREQEIAQISRSLKMLAKELDLPVIALSQLSRAVETRGGDKRPQLSDLRESGCLTGDTLVTLAETGRRVPIRDLVGQSGFDVWAADPTTLKMDRATVRHAFSTGVKPVFCMTTRSGHQIRATANHKFLTVSGWKRLDELELGEHLASPRQVEQPAIATRSKEELALLGLLIGDGCTLPRHTVQYTTRERDLADEAATLAEHIFGEAIAPRVSAERTWYQVYLTSTRHHTHGVRNAIAEWLDEMGVWGLRSHEKRVPDAVFEQPASHIAHFLRYLWATDGCIRAPKGTRYPAIYYATSSPQLARDVKALLLRVGIRSTIGRIGQGDKGRDQYHVRISGQGDMLRFAERVGGQGAYKAASTEAVCSFFAGRDANTNRDIIPRSVWADMVMPALVQSEHTHRSFQAAIGTRYCGSTLFKSNLSRARAQRVAQVLGSMQLLRLAQSDVYWDEITAIVPDGEEEVYDLTVPGPHNFVANDLVVHNSIEQDADVVAFIYRAERYGITVDENGNSTEGLGEIIIGKQRNGPIGNVQLAFVHQFARFENLTTYYADDFNGGFGGGGEDYGYDGGSGGGGSMAGGDGFGTQPPPSGGDAPF